MELTLIAMLDVLLYFFYVVGLVAVIFIFNWVHLKLETLRLKHRFLESLVDKGYETDGIDLNKILN